MRRCVGQRKLGRLLLFFISVLAFICLLNRYAKVRENESVGKAEEEEDQGKLGGQWLTEQHGISCSDIYDMDPVAVGKSLEVRKKGVSFASDEEVGNSTTNCKRFLASRGYLGVQASKQERQFPLAYSLVVHKDAFMVERILRAIYSPVNIYCIHYDLKSSPAFVAAVQGLVRCLPNVFIASKLERVQYASITRLNADLNCLADLSKSEVRWRYVINLCGQDFPLRSNAELVDELKSLQGASMLETKRPSSGKKQRFSFRYALKDAQSQYHYVPVKTNDAKRPPPDDIEMFVGSAYFTLSREFVNFVQWSPLVKHFLDWSEDTYSPDEHFWASLIRVPGVPGEVKRSDPDISDLMSKTRLVKWQYLEGALYPACTGTHQRSVCIYGAAELHWLLNEGHWFANKLDPKVDPIFVECLEQKLAERQKERSLKH